jgi:hypothetical protein
MYCSPLFTIFEEYVIAVTADRAATAVGTTGNIAIILVADTLHESRET